MWLECGGGKEVSLEAGVFVVGRHSGTHLES